jgi:hypothetical protein
VALDDITGNLDAFQGFLRDLLSYQELLDTEDKTLEEVEKSRADLNRQLGVMNASLNALNLPRMVSMSGHEFAIFEEAFGPYTEDSALIVDAALKKAIDVTRQAIGMLEHMEAKAVRALHEKQQQEREIERRMREGDRTVVFPALPDDEPLPERRRWPFFVTGLSLGWVIAVYRWTIVDFLRYTYTAWSARKQIVFAIIVGLLLLSSGFFVNLLTNGGWDGIKQNRRRSVILAIGAIVSAVVAAVLAAG